MTAPTSMTFDFCYLLTGEISWREEVTDLVGLDWEKQYPSALDSCLDQTQNFNAAKQANPDVRWRWRARPSELAIGEGTATYSHAVIRRA